MNDEWLDALIRHQIFLLRTGGAIRNDMLAILDATNAELVEAVRRLYSPRSGIRATRRVDRLIETITDIRSAAWADATALLIAALNDLQAHETSFLDEIIVLLLALSGRTQRPTLTSTRSLLVRGSTLAQWMRDLEASDAARLTSQLRLARVEGASVTAAVAWMREMFAITRRAVDSQVRTSVISASSRARSLWAGANAGLFDRDLFVAVLDSRTTPICRSLDGETFPVGKGPHPPLHFYCRSIRMPLLAGEPAPQRQTYGTWLRAQPAAEQDDILGPTRGKLFRSGGLTLDRFVNRSGDEIPLKELASREAAAFRAAGLNVHDFA